MQIQENPNWEKMDLLKGVSKGMKEEEHSLFFSLCLTGGITTSYTL